MKRLSLRACPQASRAPEVGLGRFGRFGRFLPVLLALVLLGNLIDCVRVEQRTPVSMQVAQRRPRRTRGRRQPG